ncbi:hypothetical protein DFJ66_7842 [Saccharothrix variisporea]|uniref:Uncharacterized protein n=1 Tax=Saccharothrix variisporea TaxID=543527 RepID=A0A495XKS2_9PSEU|nr:hypothetical protein DFJ66_7842 [Saccharothrix variisporea]
MFVDGRVDRVGQVVGGVVVARLKVTPAVTQETALPARP